MHGRDMQWDFGTHVWCCSLAPNDLNSVNLSAVAQVMTNGGHERTFKEWEDLLHSAGLKLEHVRTPPGQFQSILTIKPQK